MVLPVLSPEQRLAALEKAVVVRKARADVKGQLARGEVSLREVLDQELDGDVASPVSRMRVNDLVRSMPGYGVAKAGRLLESLGIATSRRVAGLGSVQRQALIEHFER